MNNRHLAIIKTEIERFFNMTTFEIEGIEILDKENVFYVSIKTEDSLIGERGETLLDIQQLLRLLIRKKMQDNLFIELDINDYKKEKESALKKIAIAIANEVVFQQKEKALPPMNAFERRIIHIALKEKSDVKTESVGKGSERRIIVSPHSYSK